MPRYTVELSEQTAKVIDDAVAQGLQPSPAAYVEELVQAEQARREEQELFERLLDESFESGPPIPVDDKFWAERRRKLEESIARTVK